MDQKEIQRHEEKINTILGKPVFPEFSEVAKFSRRNLIYSASIGILIELYVVNIESFAGLVFKESMGVEIIRYPLIAIVLYNLLHFFFFSVEFLTMTRIRLTGIWDEGQGAFEEGDYPHEAHNSTLMSWWLDKSKRRIKKLKPIIDELDEHVIEIRNIRKDFLQNPSQIPKDIKGLFQGIARLLPTLKSDINQMLALQSSRRVEVSLARFEGWFRSYGRLQIIRFIIFEISIPIILGFISFTMLLTHFP